MPVYVRLFARLTPVFLLKKCPSFARLFSNMGPSEEFGTLTMEGSGPSWRRLSQFVQISEFFQFYITDICQTSESFPISIKLKQEYTVKELFLRSKAGEMKPFRRDWSFQVRGGIKKTVFFFQQSETPPPFFWPPQFFLIRIFWLGPDPPPFRRKMVKTTSFFIQI